MQTLKDQPFGDNDVIADNISLVGPFTVSNFLNASGGEKIQVIDGRHGDLSWHLIYHLHIYM